jgi:hypothetical protein
MDKTGNLFKFFTLFRFIFITITPIAVSLVFTNCDRGEDPQPLIILSISPTRGNEGSTVIIEGTGFGTTDNVVKFNNLPATITAATSTQLTVIVPAGATDGGITVTTNNTTIQSANMHFIVTDRWQQMADIGFQARHQPGFHFSLNGKGYAGAGLGSGSAVLHDFWEYDPASNVWTQKQDFQGTSCANAIGFGVGTKGYAGGGYLPIGGTNSTSSFWEYDPADNEWRPKKNVSIGNHTTCFVIGSKAYVGTGFKGTGSNSLMEYDPASDQWTAKKDLPVGLVDAFGFAIGAKGYIGGGRLSGNLEKHYGLYEYDPATDQWTPKAELPNEINPGARGSFSSGSKGYVGGPEKQFWQFDPVTNAWTRKADLPGAIGNYGIGFTLSDYGYLGALTNKTFFRYTPE